MLGSVVPALRVPPGEFRPIYRHCHSYPFSARLPILRNANEPAGGIKVDKNTAGIAPPNHNTLSMIAWTSQWQPRSHTGAVGSADPAAPARSLDTNSAIPRRSVRVAGLPLEVAEKMFGRKLCLSPEQSVQRRQPLWVIRKVVFVIQISSEAAPQTNEL
jgi:hypothetical protein